MLRTLSSALLPAAVFVLMMYSPAPAHVVCGDRVFPTTLTMDDPGVSDELSFPTIVLAPSPSGQTNVYGYEWDKTITEDLGFGVNGDYVTSPAQNQSGWDNLTVTLKDQHPCIQKYEHEEFVWSLGLVREIPGTGSMHGAGNTAPAFYFGKGLGDLPIAFLRPLAITGELSRQFSDSPAMNPNAWNYAASLQYSMPYLQQHVKALNVPHWIARLTPVVEVAMSTQDGGSPTGTISPGILYDSDSWQLGAEITIPVNGITRQSQGTGFIIQFHAFLDTFYKSWFGKPLVRGNLWK